MKHYKLVDFFQIWMSSPPSTNAKPLLTTFWQRFWSERWPNSIIKDKIGKRHFADPTRGITTGGQGEHNSPGAEWLRGAESPNNVTSTFFSTVHLLPKDFTLEHGGARLVSWSGRHLTSLRPWIQYGFNSKNLTWMQSRILELKQLFLWLAKIQDLYATTSANKQKVFPVSFAT